MAAVVTAIQSGNPVTPAELFMLTGMTLISTVGGASGPLYGTMFLRMAATAGDRQRLDGEEFAASLRAGLGGIVARGRADAGDKTMYDALAPACDALDTKLRDGGSCTKRWTQPLTRPPKGETRPSACWLVRDGRHISASAASATRTPVPHR